ncbi:MAG: DUF885 domain-containing protein [Clostridium sp.]|nr:DUF885 domain-containing protein [Clostridium sp.]
MPLGKKLTRKQKLFCLAALLLAGLLFLYYCLFANDSRKFKALSEELFYSELSGDTLSLHYTLAWPEKWGFTGDAVLSSYVAEEENLSDEYNRQQNQKNNRKSGSNNSKSNNGLKSGNGSKNKDRSRNSENDSAADIASVLERLSKISRDRLSASDAYTYDLLSRYLALRLEGAAYPYYSEPLAPSSGMQSGLPILLADYTFRCEKDVEDYLHLLDQTDTYFEGLIQYEKEKSQNGLFMSDASAGKIVKQCMEIMDRDLLASGSHFLHATFQERLDALVQEGVITASQKENWISENDRLLTTVMAPAYEEVADAFTILQGSGANSMGLCYFPDGRAYYEYLLASTTGSSRAIPEIKSMLWKDFQQNIAALINLYNTHPELASTGSGIQASFPLSTPEEMLADLQSRIASDFPAFPASEDFAPSCTIKSVSPSMENYTSPAYYLTPPIDDMSHNIIYINHKNSPDALTLYTTLAHEGYPGHLYQTVYSQLYMNRQNVSPIRYLLHYGGYVEGWALYVENLSYGYAQQLLGDAHPQTALWYEACRLDRNLQLCLYSLLDIAIHYEGATPRQVQAILGKIGITNAETVSAIYQYIAEGPVTYLKYYLGFLEFLALQDSARSAWGDEFTLQRFHQFVLETGPSDFQGLHEMLAAS